LYQAVAYFRTLLDQSPFIFLTDELMGTMLDLPARAVDACLTQELKTGASSEMTLMLEGCATKCLLESGKGPIRCARHHREFRRPAQ
jgi:hypothetical protein